MRATFTDEQKTLAETARDLASGGRESARAILEGGGRPDEPTNSLVGGFSGLGIPVDAGGAGGNAVDLGILLEALGRQVVPTPFVSHILAVHTAHAAGLDVTGAASGDVTWALAADEAGASPGERATALESGRLYGVKPAVRDGASCDAAVVVAEDAVAIAVPSERSERDALDVTRPLADLRFDGDVLDSAEAGDQALGVATAAAAAELVGVGRGAVDLAVEYANIREQFGQTIGRFQGVAHQLADAWTGVENAWSLALYATWAVSAGAADATRAVHAAKSAAGEAAIHAAERSTQVHGGTGITWEADPHLYLRRALADDAWLGSGRWHRRQLGHVVLAR